MRLRSKVAIITGSTGAIGRATAERFLDEGAEVALLGVRNRPEWIPRSVYYRSGDVTDDDWVGSTVTEIVGSFGPPDVLVTAHGIDFHSGLPTTDLESARRVLDVNVTGVLIAMRHVIARMTAAGKGGSIVNVGSRLGQVAIPGQAVYSASKAAIVMLSKGAALDHARDNIRVNVVAPGMTATPMIEGWIAQQPDPAAFRRKLESSVPMGRLASTTEIANAIVFAASDEASFMTGAVVMVDGGYTAK